LLLLHVSSAAASHIPTAWPARNLHTHPLVSITPAAAQVLQKLRGASADVDLEWAEIEAAAAGTQGKSVWSGWRQLFSRACLPELISGCAVAAFSQVRAGRRLPP
jgi:hypothetical protein